MKRVLKITATNGGTTAKVRIEVVCSRWGQAPFFSSRTLSRTVLSAIADGVMEALRNADYFHAPLSRQRVDR